MVHLYYGNGKGKTTAALGLALRASGRGQRVLICRFLKNKESGETAALGHLPNVTVMDCGCMNGFLPQMAEADRQQAASEQRKAFDNACLAVSEGGYDLVVLDEVLWLAQLGVVPPEQIAALAEKLRYECEVVLTGGAVWDGISACADYITHMEKLRHPFDKGEPARPGVEF